MEDHSLLTHSALDLLNRPVEDKSWLGRLKVCGQIEVVYQALMSARGDLSDEVCRLSWELSLVSLR
jgi:hypothetical protein